MFDMATAEGPNKPETFNVVIDKKHVPLYEEAAGQTGYEVKVTAREGQQTSVEYLDQKTGKAQKVKVSHGYVEVAITTPPGEKTTSPFFNAVRALEQPPK